MTDRMDPIIEAAEQQGFEVRQTAEATWIFRKGLNTIVQPRPASTAEWLSFVAALRELGSGFPARVREEIERCHSSGLCE